MSECEHCFVKLGNLKTIFGQLEFDQQSTLALNIQSRKGVANMYVTRRGNDLRLKKYTVMTLT